MRSLLLRPTGELRAGWGRRWERSPPVRRSPVPGDHVTGLLGLLQTMSLAQRTREVTIVAPSALSRWLKITAETLHIGLTFQVRFKPSRVGTVYRGRDYRVRAARAIHSVEAYSYLLEEFERPGAFHR